LHRKVDEFLESIAQAFDGDEAITGELLEQRGRHIAQEVRRLRRMMLERMAEQSVPPRVSVTFNRQSACCESYGSRLAPPPAYPYLSNIVTHACRKDTICLHCTPWGIKLDRKLTFSVLSLGQQAVLETRMGIRVLTTTRNSNGNTSSDNNETQSSGSIATSSSVATETLRAAESTSSNRVIFVVIEFMWTVQSSSSAKGMEIRSGQPLSAPLKIPGSRASICCPNDCS